MRKIREGIVGLSAQCRMISLRPSASSLLRSLIYPVIPLAPLGPLYTGYCSRFNNSHAIINTQASDFDVSKLRSIVGQMLPYQDVAILGVNPCKLKGIVG